MPHEDFRDEATGKLFEQIGYEAYQAMPPYREQYFSPALATVSQISCLIGLSMAFRFSDGRRIQQILEVGTNTGVTSLYLLKAGVRGNPRFRLHSIEKVSAAFCGHAVRESASEEELSHWNFCQGKTAFDIEDILEEGTRLDMVFIDGAHAHPYPLLDLVFLLPYLHEESLVVVHDVESYMVIGEQGNSYLYTRWPGKDKYLNWDIDHPDMVPTRKEYMGILRIPADRRELHAILLDLAAQPIDAPRWQYAAPGEEDALGIDEEMLDGKLRGFMQKHYAGFADAFVGTLLGALRAYRASWMASKHRNRIENTLLEQMAGVVRRLRFLRQMVLCHLPQGTFGVARGKRYAICGSGGKYHEAWEEILRAGAQTAALVDIDQKMHGHTWRGMAIQPESYLAARRDAYDGIVIASIDHMEEVLAAILSLGIPRDIIHWVDLSGVRQ